MNNRNNNDDVISLAIRKMQKFNSRRRYAMRKRHQVFNTRPTDDIEINIGRSKPRIPAQFFKRFTQERLSPREFFTL